MAGEGSGMSSLDDRHRTVGEHYDGAAHEFELARLDHRSPVERAMMERYLARFVPESSVVADVGGGAGHYDESLARRGCRLYLADVSVRLLEAAQERLASHGLTDQVIDARLASATDLSHIADRSCDAVLMLGPLYHLLTLMERRQAVREAKRLLRDGGVFLASGVSRLAGLAAGYYIQPDRGVELREVYRRFLDDGIVDPELAPTIGHAHFTRAAEFRALFEDDFEELAFVGLESFTGSRQQLFIDLAADLKQAWLDLVEASAADPEGIGLSEHYLFVGRPRAG
jgi:ubiquinone/menaquinone biosynthesis C-methylase UbiE